MAKLVVIGAGAMGLAAAYRATERGHDVTVLEAAAEAGGMAAHFSLGGLSIERFYHFICKDDQPTFALLRELGLEGKLRWRGTSMGYFTGGALHPWGTPTALLRFPGLRLMEKLRYGALMFLSTRRFRWPSLEQETAKAWITRWCGAKTYDTLWRPLMELKFHQHADEVSAAWMWTRIRRLGRSRRSLMQEELGYLEGGSETLVSALCSAILKNGGRIRLGEGAREVRSEQGRVTGVQTERDFFPADRVIVTIPTPGVARLVPSLSSTARAAYEAIVNIGVVCVVMRLKRSVSPHFWINVAEPSLPIPGLIEFSNLRPAPEGEAVVYVPYYMPLTHPNWTRADQAFVTEALSCLQAVNPAIMDDDLIVAHVGRLRHAQPVCTPGFAARLPPIRTEIGGLQIADTCFYYPEDRGIAESLRLGASMADAL